MKALLVGNTDWYLYNFRLPLAKALAARGFEVVLVSPPGSYTANLATAGFRHVAITLDRRGANPLHELQAIRHLMRIYRAERPDLVHHFTIKPVIYGTLAARLLGMTGVVNEVTGLGYTFTDADGGRGRRRLIRTITLALYRRARLGVHGGVIFQNPDNLEQFERLQLVPPGRAILIGGSGVDTAYLGRTAPPADSVPNILFAGRLLRDKGIFEYVEAARILAARGCKIRFRIAGAPDTGNPSSVSPQTLEEWHRDGIVELLGHRDDIHQWIGRAWIVALPSYAEGVPRALVEAAAMGKPLIATDVPGCREVVRHEETGLLVPVGNPESLADAIALLSSRPDLCQMYGERARLLAQREFDLNIVVEKTFQVYESVLGRRLPSGLQVIPVTESE